MRKHISTILLGPALILVSFFAQPQSVEAQCMVTNTLVSSGTVMSPYNVVYKTLNGPYVCNRVASNNVSLCAPGTAPLARTMLTASADTAATNPSCQWYCTGGCGTITIDKNDGLPVELMEFEIVEVESDEEFKIAENFGEVSRDEVASAVGKR